MSRYLSSKIEKKSLDFDEIAASKELDRNKRVKSSLSIAMNIHKGSKLQKKHEYENSKLVDYTIDEEVKQSYNNQDIQIYAGKKRSRANDHKKEEF